MSTANAIPAAFQNANPMLYTFQDYHTDIQPYFIIVLQYFFFEISLRTWNRVVYKTWYKASEIVFVDIIEKPTDRLRGFRPGEEPPPPPPPPPPPRRSSNHVVYVLQRDDHVKKRPNVEARCPVFDLFDLVVYTLPLLAHAIWYCYIQSSCTSGQYATTWNCYNLFGYRVYNYLFAPYTHVAKQFVSKLCLWHQWRDRIRVEHALKRPWTRVLSKIIFWPALVFSAITFFFVGAIVLPYSFTHAIPMIVLYCFIVLIYAYLIVIVVILVNLFRQLTKKFYVKGQTGIKASVIETLQENPDSLIVSAALGLFPTLMTILFNLSQYFYFGNDYLGSLSREADSRNPDKFFFKARSSPILAHTVLSSI